MTDDKKIDPGKTHVTLFPFQLNDIRLYEIIIERCDPEDKENKTLPVSIGLVSSDIDVEEGDFGILLTFDAGFPIDDKPVCKIHLSIEGLFNTVVDVDTIKPEALDKFKSKDAMVLFWPYLRQTLHDITDRMHLGIPPLPIIDPSVLVEAISEEPKDTKETAKYT
jgi:preprotein translocase subunit SecB